ncbi:hypothetical protein LMH87_012014 [Akanthomyces muscarius]|uniref:Uncharacterized protein n=1 Tax=Akanthomyces muscarius TaxID=2231603 RepID=A0A9W8QCT1_AKAMU|nr:hypothetical protein LMH87_012014 [Akanthomyces muscarius]KAJ4151305.1 hypothetical protein LMH87_012014 [Akanthomyces muscarius]
METNSEPHLYILTGSTTLEDNNSSHLRVETIFYSPLIPDYPSTSLSGIAYIIPTNSLQQEDIIQPWNTIQYCSARKIPGKKSSVTIFHVKNKAITWAHAQLKAFSHPNQRGCNPRRDTCRLILYITDLSRISHTAEKHAIFNNEALNEEDSCYAIHSTRRKKKTCDMNHLQRQGRLQPGKTTSIIPFLANPHLAYYNQPESSRYIQYFEDNGEDYLAICFFQEQAKLFQDQKVITFQMDANYKHRFGQQHVELIWAYYSDNANKSITLLRAYYNNEGANTIEFIFKKVHEIFYQRYNFTLKWNYLHGEGLIGVTMDQAWDGIKGFGPYLTRANVSSTSRSLHQQSYVWTGRFLPLLNCIESSKILDRVIMQALAAASGVQRQVKRTNISRDTRFRQRSNTPLRDNSRVRSRHFYNVQPPQEHFQINNKDLSLLVFPLM